MMNADDKVEENSPRSEEDEHDMPSDFEDDALEKIQALLNESIANAEQQNIVLKQFLAMMRANRTLTPEEREFLASPVPRPLEFPDMTGLRKCVADGYANNIMNIASVAKYIADGKAKNIIVMAGAGISVSAGIPDFRTPGTGLYYNLQKYDFADPQELFTLSYFCQNPKPFFEVAKSIYPDLYHPTKTHYFIRLLHEHGLLLRDFTQNIDTLEVIAGIPTDKLVFSHGSFAKSHCIGCRKEFSYEYVRDKVFSDQIAVCDACGAYVKPDIVFFGESLPEKFFERMHEDFPKCDLLIVMGTSLAVQPFAGLIAHVPETVPRLLINREVVCCKPEPPPADADEMDRYRYRVSSRFAFKDPENRRDALYQGSCDDAVQALADALGWGKELQALFDAPLPDKTKLFLPPA